MKFLPARPAPIFLWPAAVCLVLHFGLSAGFVHAAPGPLKAVVILDEASPVSENAFSVLQGHVVDFAVELYAERVPALSSDLRVLNRYFASAAATYQADIVVFSDFSDPNEVVLYVSMPKLGTTLIRNIDSENETIESRIEITAVVIRGILSAMASGAEIGVHVTDIGTNSANTAECDARVKAILEQEAREAAPRKDDSHPKEKWGATRAAVQAIYGFGLVSSDTSPVQHFQGTIRLSVKSMGVFLAYRGTFPFGKENENLSLALTPHPATVGFWTSFQKKNIFFRLGAGLLFDPLSVKATPKTESAENRADMIDFRIAATPFIAVDWYVSKDAYVTVAIVADFYIFQNAFYVKQGDTEVNFLRLWPVSPLFQVGFGFGFFE